MNLPKFPQFFTDFQNDIGKLHMKYTFIHEFFENNKERLGWTEKQAKEYGLILKQDFGTFELKYVKKNGLLLEVIPIPNRTPEICLEAVKQNKKAFAFIPNPRKLPNAKEVYQAADVPFIEDEKPKPEPESPCGICMENRIKVAFNCGHGSCFSCSEQLKVCHMCKREITTKTQLFF